MSFFAKSSALLVQPLKREPKRSGSGFYQPGAMFTFYGGREGMNDKFPEGARIQMFVNVRRLGELLGWFCTAHAGCAFSEIHKPTKEIEKRMRFTCQEHEPQGMEAKNMPDVKVLRYTVSIKELVDGKEQRSYSVPLSMGDGLALRAMIPYMIAAALGYTSDTQDNVGGTADAERESD